MYFYDNTGSILARLKNQTAFDYGCTQVIIDRAGSSGIADVQMVDAAGKVVFRKSVQLDATASIYKLVLPKENIPTGVYFVTVVVDGKPFSKKVIKQ